MEEANRILRIAEKYDMPGLIKVTETRLCESAAQMSFAKPPKEGDHNEQEDYWNAARWLAIAERLNMRDLQTQCQITILRDIAASMTKPLSLMMQGQAGKEQVQRALSSLEEHGVSVRSLAEMVLGLVDKSRHFVRAAYGKCSRCPVCKHLQTGSKNQKCPTCDCSTVAETNACQVFVELRKEEFQKNMTHLKDPPRMGRD